MKWFWPDLKRRAQGSELMDDLTLEAEELGETLTQLRLINRLLGAARPTLEGVSRLWHSAGCPKRLSLLDVGAGSGEVTDYLLRWGDRQGVKIQLTLLDIHPYTCTVAANRYRAESRVSVIQGNVHQLGVRQVDIVTASLFLHHFQNRQLTPVLNSMQNVAQLGVVVNDLHRHWIAWAFVKVVTRLFSRNRLIRHDGPLSVRRGFRAPELERLKRETGLEQLQYGWRPLFRYLIILPARNGKL